MTTSGATGAPVPMEVDCRTVKSRLDRQDDFLLLDCREADEHALVRIAGAELLQMSEIQSRIGELEPQRDRDIVVHCHHGGRSLRVAAWLRQQGFARAQSMAGGIDQWAAEIDPTLTRY
ncbi:MAG: rhodanese [Planctomycetaceae bacterium]|nr:rhodanese [Planctomycetaceae bacterium]